MQVHVLNQAKLGICLSVFDAGPAERGRLVIVAGDGAGAEMSIRPMLESRGYSQSPAMAVLRVPYGGREFTGPSLWTQETAKRLEKASAGAGLPVARTTALARAYEKSCPACPILLTFETAFFADLPDREALYGLDAGLMKSLDIRRFGFHGLYHDAASRHAARQIADAGNVPVPRVISICLEQKPELAAVSGRRPVMVTGGATPIEGLPGETSCGDLDPSIPLKLAGAQKMGPEQLDLVLGRESGLAGLAGRDIDLVEALDSTDAAEAFAGDVFRYRLLLACGAGISAMGGIDSIVLSGRYAKSGESLGRWLINMLMPAIPQCAAIKPLLFDESLELILARHGYNALRKAAA